jgi:HSP20 family protein
MVIEEDIWETIEKMRREIDRLTRTMFKPLVLRPIRGIEEFFGKPFADISETEEDVIVRLDMPGIKKEDIEILATPTSIEVKAEARKIVEEKGETFFRRERAYKGYHRMLSLPCEVKTEDIVAEYSDGVLTIRLKKKEKAKKVKVELK